MLNNYYQPDPRAVRTFDNLWTSIRPWILIFLGDPRSGKSRFLSWLIENRCRAGRIPYSLVGRYTYTSDIDSLFTSMAESIISTSQFSRDQAVRITKKLTGGETEYWVGLPDDMRLMLFFDDYQTFEAESTTTKEQRSTFLDRINHAHMRLPGLRVVIASTDQCQMPDAWFYMQESTYFRQESEYFRL